MVREIKRVRMVITGRVQGVCYRAFASDEARRLGLRGWVMNMPDGSVQVLAEGNPESLKQLEAWCRQGPPYARVTKVEVREEPVCQGELSSFDIRYSLSGR